MPIRRAFRVMDNVIAGHGCGEPLKKFCLMLPESALDRLDQASKDLDVPMSSLLRHGLSLTLSGIRRGEH